MPWLLMVASLVGAWRDMEIEKLPGLGPSESVEAWFERTTHNKSVPDIAWWQYQQEVLALCEPLWHTSCYAIRFMYCKMILRKAYLASGDW